MSDDVSEFLMILVVITCHVRLALTSKISMRSVMAAATGPPESPTSSGPEGPSHQSCGHPRGIQARPFPKLFPNFSPNLYGKHGNDMVPRRGGAGVVVIIANGLLGRQQSRSASVAAFTTVRFITHG